MDFFDELRNYYSPIEFTGHIGVLLEDESAEDEELRAARKFLYDIYKLAMKHI